MTVTVIAMITIAEDAPAALAQYLAVTTPMLERVGARITQRFAINEVVVGYRPAKSIIMVQYPSREAVAAVFLSKEYADLIPVRDKAFESYHISIVDQMPSVPSEAQGPALPKILSESDI